MYQPHQVGIPNLSQDNVSYIESPPRPDLQHVVFCIWELRSLTPLPEDFLYLILPDACTDIIFDLNATHDKVLVMASDTEASQINLGKAFHFVGIRFFPGVIDPHTAEGLVHNPDLHQTWQRLHTAQNKQDQNNILQTCVASLLSQDKITKNLIMYRLMAKSADLKTVSDIETLTGYTRRQLQRIFKQKLGLSPRDFLKILRFQHTFSGVSRYVDQSHLIKEYKRITGLTPKTFKTIY